MSKILSATLVAVVFTATSFATSNPVQVLYLSNSASTNISLTTYNVDAETAVSQQVGEPIVVGASSVDPVTVNGKHVIYVWNATDVWLYLTNANGVPQSAATQHLTFGFPHPVTTFLADPDGKFAYAGMTWQGEGENSYAVVVLFTIDQTTGELSTTGKEAATYGPNPYTGLTSFLFGASGERLYARYFDNGPYTCIVGYDYYPVNPSNGRLGPLANLFYGQADCSGSGNVAVTDLLTVSASACCGAGSGGVLIANTVTQQNIGCDATNLTFCGDPVGNLYLDPANRNVFFGDAASNQTDIGHIDFAAQTLIQSGSIIPGTPALYFSPDSRLVYAQNSGNIGIYTLQSGTGELGANTTFPVEGNISVATALLN